MKLSTRDNVRERERKREGVYYAIENTIVAVPYCNVKNLYYFNLPKLSSLLFLSLDL
jgi:hypothetical protein